MKKDEEPLQVVMRVNPRAKRLTFRVKPDGIYVSVPPGTSTQEVERAVAKLHDRLLAVRQRTLRPLIDLNFRIDAECFKLSLVEGEKERFFVNSQSGIWQIVCPPQTDFTDGKLQEWLRKVFEGALKQRAKQVLPVRLAQLAERCGLTYRSVRIKACQSRWGSCSSQKNINLSCFLMLLPLRLIDYVLLHELCHTLEMNHGPRFRELLNRFTDGTMRESEEELKRFRSYV